MCWVVVAISSDQCSILELSEQELSCPWVFLETGNDWVGSPTAEGQVHAGPGAVALGGAIPAPGTCFQPARAKVRNCIQGFGHSQAGIRRGLAQLTPSAKGLLAHPFPVLSLPFGTGACLKWWLGGCSGH